MACWRILRCVITQSQGPQHPDLTASTSFIVIVGYSGMTKACSVLHGAGVWNVHGSTSHRAGGTGRKLAWKLMLTLMLTLVMTRMLTWAPCAGGHYIPNLALELLSHRDHWVDAGQPLPAAACGCKQRKTSNNVAAAWLALAGLVTSACCQPCRLPRCLLPLAEENEQLRKGARPGSHAYARQFRSLLGHVPGRLLPSCDSKPVSSSSCCCCLATRHQLIVRLVLP